MIYTGGCNDYGPFILSDILKPEIFERADTLHTQAAFVLAEDALAHAAMLQHPSPDASLCFNVDASDVAVGTVLEQRIAGTLYLKFCVLLAI